MNESNNKKHVIVVGCGLVGSLVAIFMAKRGYEVEVYEKREDIRKMKTAQGRSINLSLSNRARAALAMAGLEDKVLEAGVPMMGRLIHNISGNTKSIPYDPINGQCLFSISRNFLNAQLISALEEYRNVKLFFNHKTIFTDVDEISLRIENTQTKQIINRRPDLIIAADGAYSTVRRDIQKSSIFTFSQTYIEHGYLELSIGADKGTKMIPNHLHIWPRGAFMMIALPNLDSSWTVTLFMPFKIFESLSDNGALIRFFKATFPDFFDFASEEELIGDFYRKKPMPLVSIKCEPYNFRRILLIGDAAHAMVPFYGQGMNAGFEDCLILDDLLDRYKDDVEKCFDAFTDVRKRDAHAICDLAMYNYVEMRDLVNKTSFKVRKWFDEFMFWMLPEMWIPLYNSVTFSRMGYRKCVENRKWQDQVLKYSSIFLILLIALFAFYIKISF